MASETAARLKADVVAAMKAHDKARLGVLRMLQAALKQVEVDQRKELQEDDVLKVVQSYAKKVKDALDGAHKGGRDDLVAQNEAELAIVESYLPTPLSDSELDGLVGQVIAETGATSLKDMGKVIQAVMLRTTGRAEGARVSAAVKRQLQK